MGGGPPLYLLQCPRILERSAVQRPSKMSRSLNSAHSQIPGLRGAMNSGEFPPNCNILELLDIGLHTHVTKVSTGDPDVGI